MSIPPPHLRILSLVLLTMIRILAPHLGFAMTWISAPPLGLVQILDFALTILTAHRMIAILLMIFYLYRIQTLILLVGCADVGGADVNVAPTDYFALRVWKTRVGTGISQFWGIAFLFLVGKCWMLACPPDPQKDRHAMSEPTFWRHVIWHVGNMMQKRVAEGADMTHDMSDFLTCRHHVGKNYSK